MNLLSVAQTADSGCHVLFDAVTPSLWLELALGAVTPRDFGILIGFVFHRPTLAPPLLPMLLLLPLPPHFSNGIIDLVIFVVLTYRP
jgi:hypothetical protein